MTTEKDEPDHRPLVQIQGIDKPRGALSEVELRSARIARRRRRRDEQRAEALLRDAERDV